MNSCSSLLARSNVFLPWSSVRRLFISLHDKHKQWDTEYVYSRTADTEYMYWTQEVLILEYSHFLLPYTCTLYISETHLYFSLQSFDAEISICFTHRMFSTVLGLMKMAMGWSWASCSLFIAFPETSRIQCLPWGERRGWSWATFDSARRRPIKVRLRLHLDQI